MLVNPQGIGTGVQWTMALRGSVTFVPSICQCSGDKYNTLGGILNIALDNVVYCSSDIVTIILCVTSI